MEHFGEDTMILPKIVSISVIKLVSAQENRPSYGCGTKPQKSKGEKKNEQQ